MVVWWTGPWPIHMPIVMPTTTDQQHHHSHVLTTMENTDTDTNNHLDLDNSDVVKEENDDVADSAEVLDTEEHTELEVKEDLQQEDDTAEVVASEDLSVVEKPEPDSTESDDLKLEGSDLYEDKTNLKYWSLEAVIVDDMR